MTLWMYAFVPVTVAGAGATYAALRRPSDSALSVIQHFAAGVIFYAAAGELLPDTLRHRLTAAAVTGGAVSIAAVTALRKLAEATRSPVGFIGAAAVDALIDGLVLGLGFNAGAHQGRLLAIALAIEFLFLGLSLPALPSLASLPSAAQSRWRGIGPMVAISLAVPLGVLMARPLAGVGAAYQTAAFGFGLIAVLYLVTEELLVEAHEKPETVWGPVALFVGFLSMLVLDQHTGT